MFKKIALSALLGLCSASSMASDIRVICSNNDGSKWHWLPDMVRVDRNIVRKWQRLDNATMATLLRVKISRDDYTNLKNFCANYYPETPYPAPADRMSYDWYIFTIEEDGKLKDQQGRVTVVKAIDLPVFMN